MTQKKQAILLIRVSDSRQEREGLSLDNQEQTLRRYAAENDLEIVREFRFQETADYKIRRRFNEVVSFIRKRPSVTCVVGYRVDRLTRNFRDHVLLDDLRLIHEKELHFVYDRLVVGPKTVGKAIQDWDTKVYLAKMYLNRLKEDAVISAAFKLSRGEWPGKAPFGYRNARVNERSTIEVYEPEARIVRFCFDLYGTGAYSMQMVRMRVKDEFDVQLSKGKLDFILKTTFYYGQMRFNGAYYPHMYEPLISYSQFERVQAIKDSFQKQPHKFAGLDFAYRGMIRCAQCGCQITPERKIKPGGKTYLYYHCTEYHGKHEAAWISEENLTKQFLAFFDGLTIPEKELQEITQTLKEAHQAKIAFTSSARAHLLTERAKYEQRRQVLYEDRLDGILPKETYLSKLTSTDEQIARIEFKLRDLDAADEEYYLTACYLLELYAHAGQTFRKGTATERRILINIALQNCTLKEKTLLWELKKPLDTVFTHISRQEWLRLTDLFRNREALLNVNLQDVERIFSLLEQHLQSDDPLMAA